MVLLHFFEIVYILVFVSLIRLHIPEEQGLDHCSPVYSQGPPCSGIKQVPSE